MRDGMWLMFVTALIGWNAAAYAAEPLPAPHGPVVLTISGHIEQTNAPGRAQFDMAMLEALGKKSFTTSSEVSEKPQLFEGVPLQAVLDRVGAHGKAFKATALNEYHITIPAADLKFGPILAMRVDGKVLTARDKGPLWIAYPRDAHKVLQDVKYDARWVWQLNRLSVE